MNIAKVSFLIMLLLIILSSILVIVLAITVNIKCIYLLFFLAILTLPLSMLFIGHKGKK